MQSYRSLLLKCIFFSVYRFFNTLFSRKNLLTIERMKRSPPYAPSHDPNDLNLVYASERSSIWIATIEYVDLYWSSLWPLSISTCNKVHSMAINTWILSSCLPLHVDIYVYIYSSTLHAILWTTMTGNNTTLTETRMHGIQVQPVLWTTMTANNTTFSYINILTVYINILLIIPCP